MRRVTGKLSKVRNNAQYFRVCREEGVVQARLGSILSRFKSIHLSLLLTEIFISVVKLGTLRLRN